MYASINCGGFTGISPYISHVEVDINKTLPGFDLVGKLSLEVREARERVMVALKNSGIDLPPLHITVNISPANLQKTGTGYDLAIAIGIMAALGHLPDFEPENFIIIGELGLNGELSPVKGILPVILCARNSGIKSCIVPIENGREASYVKGVSIYPASSFAEALSIAKSNGSHPAGSLPFSPLEGPGKSALMDFNEITGQVMGKRAAIIAASGMHHLLIVGPPGCGKSMLASRIPTILPPLKEEEILEISSIYSIAGLTNDKKPIITDPPFQSPHHSCSSRSLTGGGPNIRPGILTLSHRGVLFMDELPEFSRECLEVLREPLETGEIQINRCSGSFLYPARFALVAAANPCPCGYYPDRNLCNCSDNDIRRYKNKISGPIKDRIDLIVTSEKIEAEKIISRPADSDQIYTSANMKKMVMSARKIQQERFKNTATGFNSRISSGDLAKYCPLGPAEQDFCREIYDRLNLTARSFHKMLKVARTIADLDNSENISVPHLSEAVCYRGGEV